MIEWLPALSLREPLWLLLAPLCVAIHLFWRRSDSLPARLRAYAEPGLLKWLIVEPSDRSRYAATLIAWLLIALAISGPILVDRERQQTRPGIDIVVVLDISPSMLSGDVEPDRLRRARLEAGDFLQRLRGDRVALVAFSAHAYRVMPLSTDLAVIPWYLDALGPALTRLPGSNPVPALELASRLLTAHSPEHGGAVRELAGRELAGGAHAIVLLSDGEFPDSAAVLAAADRLADRRIPVFALGIGTTAGGPVPTAGGYQRDRDGEVVVSRRDRALLAQLAARTGGRYADLRADGRDWDHLLAGIDALARSERTVPAADDGLPLHPWLLALGLGLLLATRLRRMSPALPAFALAIGTMSFIVPEAHSAPRSERTAYEALEAGRYADAEARYREVDSYQGRLGAGAAAYRQGHWRDALAWFTEAEAHAADDRERAVATYNRANTLARLGRLDEALSTFDSALALHPNHARAALNRDLVQRALSRRAANAPGDTAAAPREDPDAPDISPGAVDDPRAGGDTDIDTGISNRSDASAGTPGDAGRSRVIARPQSTDATRPLAAGGIPGEAARSALVRLDAVDDDAAEVLRHRFMLMDAERPRAQEERPW